MRQIKIKHTETGEERLLDYIPETMTVIDTDGVDFTTKYPKMYTEREAHKPLAISLGFSCNMSCAYCFQKHIKKEKFDIDRLLDLLDKIYEIDTSDRSVDFWGGEPLMHFKEIEFLVKSLKAKPVKCFSLITNGILLDLEKAQWLANHNFYIIISHDAQSQHVRGKDPFDDPKVVEAYQWLAKNHPDRIHINSVLNGENYKTHERLQFFAKKLGVPEETINHSGEGFTYNENVPSTDVEHLEDMVYDDIIKGLGLAYTYYEARIKTAVVGMYEDFHIKDLEVKCGEGPHSHYRILNLEDKPLTMHCLPTTFKIKSLSEYNSCQTCEVSHLCRGGCPIHHEGTPQFDKNCATFKAVNRATLRAAFYLMTNKEYEAIEII